jgi:hypothetical protein
MISSKSLRTAAFALVVFITTIASAADQPKRIALIAGKPSHGPGQHEFNAGCLLLKQCLDKLPGIETAVYNDWPADSQSLEGVDAVLFFADGGAKHPAVQADHLALLGKLVNRGAGIGMLHCATEVPKEKGGAEFLDWIGAYYENDFSCNAMWTAEINRFPDHPITRGVHPFGFKDEWYFNLRFRPDMKGITPILTGKPSDEVRRGEYGGHKGPFDHVVAASGRDEVLLWTVERANGGRGLGFVAGHYHTNWANPDFRKLTLNSILWLAKVEVPPGGVESAVSAADLGKNLDVKPVKKPAAAPAK